MSHVCYFCFLSYGCASFVLSASMSASIWLNTAANFGLDVCMRLLDASAMLRASNRIWSSSAVNM